MPLQCTGAPCVKRSMVQSVAAHSTAKLPAKINLTSVSLEAQSLQNIAQKDSRLNGDTRSIFLLCAAPRVDIAGTA